MSRAKTTPIPGVTWYEYPRQGRGYPARYDAHDRVKQTLCGDCRSNDEPQRALHAAPCWLHACAHADEPRPRFWQRSGRTRTGRVGVCLRQKRDRHGAASWVYDVSDTVQGHRRTRTFRVHLFPSQAAAFQAAWAFREARERDMQRARHETLRRQWQAGEAVAGLPHVLGCVGRPRPPGRGPGLRLGVGPNKGLQPTPGSAVRLRHKGRGTAPRCG